MWGKIKREYSAVIDCYSLEEKDKEEIFFLVLRVRVKRKLVSVFFLKLVYN